MSEELKPDEQAALDAFNASRMVDELVRRNGWDKNPPCPDCGSYAHFECGGHPGMSITRYHFDGSEMVGEGIDPDDFYLAPEE